MMSPSIIQSGKMASYVFQQMARYFKQKVHWKLKFLGLPKTDERDNL